MRIPPTRELCIALGDLGAVFMETSLFRDSVTRAFLLPYRQAPARAGEFFHEHSPPPPNLMLRRCSLFIANSGPAALVCKRAISARTVCVQIPGPPAISAVPFEEQRLFLQVKPARTSRQAKAACTSQDSVKNFRFALHSSRVRWLFSRENGQPIVNIFSLRVSRVNSSGAGLAPHIGAVLSFLSKKGKSFSLASPQG